MVLAPPRTEDHAADLIVPCEFSRQLVRRATRLARVLVIAGRGGDRERAEIEASPERRVERALEIRIRAAGTSRIASTPSRSSRQNASRSDAPGKRALTPTIAIGSLAIDVLCDKQFSQYNAELVALSYGMPP